ncbi:hypothetical protein [Roseibium sp.]|uniref:hypothetical protein n=1 Tax=Roseibium sp. TaxID=1936156 RepID=UPI003B50AD4F
MKAHILFFVVLLFSFPASSQSCPDEWMNAIKLVKKFNIKQGKLFVGTDGKVFNCLNENIGSEEIQKIQIEEEEFAVLAEQRGLYPGEEFRLNECNIGEFKGRSSEARYGIYLPYDDRILSKPVCYRRIENSLKRILED